ncbi:pep-cterm sorting domain-containing protein [Anaeramoeba ignava]|uniref:Pep-cterm sorting domain-containing protein n=1 Tax=Anaeramoeba ignava TaxID=1746090 RepID=A0A9Q0LAA3_ANAIG|nr:pep-cterm sorting domain-containing protein [Anaeramoeba ignava]
MDNNNNNQIQNANQNQNENEMKNLEKKVTKNLIEDYSNLLNGNSFKDFSIFVENELNPFEIKVHKSILSLRSPFFNKFLRGKNDIDKIFLNQFNKKEMESILSYIYYGNISFENKENLIQLLEISIYFKLNLLKEIIQKKISNSINYSNFFQFLFQNRNLNSNEIEIKCFELINQNFSQIQNNENLFNLTKEEIIKFIQFKQEKKEIFQFDFFQFLNDWIQKRVKSLKLRKYKNKMNAKTRLFHSFFSLFDKDSISKQDFDKLKQFDFFPKSFLMNLQQPLLDIKEEENFKLKKENKKKDEKIKSKRKEISNLKSQNLKKNKEIEKLKGENEKKDKILKQKDEEIQNIKLSFEKEMKEEKDKIKDKEKHQKDMKSKFELIKKNFPQFSETKIIQDIEYIKKLKEWINDNDFFSKMKKGFSAKKDGFDCEKWHKAVDNKGKTLVIIKTKDNFIFGGFTQVGFTNDKSKWREEDRKNDCGYIKDENAFIFSLRNDKGDRKPEKFPIKKEREDNAIFYNFEDYGPDFGFPDLALEEDLQSGESNFGHTYNLPNGIKWDTDESKSYLAGSFNKWIVDELETYFI